ncbi:MFS transporter [Chloroflexota bacterium]
MIIRKYWSRSNFTGLLPLFVLAHFIHHVVNASLVPLLPFIRDEFSLDYTQAGFLVAAFTLPYGISQIPSGWLADRIGRRIMMAIGISGVGLAGLLVGLSQTYIMLVAFLILLGVLGGGYHPSAPPLVSASVKPENRGRALGIHLVGGSGSHFLSPLIAVAIATAWGWRSSFIGLAIPAMVFGVIFYIIMGRRALTGKGQPVATGRYEEQRPSPVNMRRLVMFIILTTGTSAVLHSAIAFIPLFLVDHFGVSENIAAVYLAIIYSAGIWAGPLGGYLSDRFGRVPVILVTCFSLGPFVFLLNLVPYGLGFGALLVIIGMFMMMRGPVAESYVVSETSERNRSTILGIYFFAGMEGVGLLTPVFGWLVDQFGFHTSFTIASVALVVVTLTCSLFLRGSEDSKSTIT